MPLSLNSLLQTWPYKKKDCLEHICKAQKLSPNGVADTLRQRILTHVEKRPETETVIREMANSYKHTETQNTKDKPTPYPLSPRIVTQVHSTPVGTRVTKPSQSLFDDPNEDENDVTINENDVTKQIDEFYEICDELASEDNERKRIPTSTEPITDDTMEWDDEAIKNGNATITNDEKVNYWVESIIHAVNVKNQQIKKLENQIAMMMDIHTKSLEKYSADLVHMKEETSTTRLLINDIFLEMRKNNDEKATLENTIRSKDDQISALQQQLCSATISSRDDQHPNNNNNNNNNGSGKNNNNKTTKVLRQEAELERKKVDVSWRCAK